MNICPYCGLQVQEQSFFCPWCGRRLTSPESTSCPRCGSSVGPDDFFCVRCGYQLASPEAREAQEGLSSGVESSLSAGQGPHLLVISSGTVIPLPDKGEVTIGREDPVTGTYPTINLAAYGGEEHGVSRLHARLILEQERAFVEDLGSLNATFLNRRLLTPHVWQEVHDGDELQFGSLTFLFVSR